MATDTPAQTTSPNIILIEAAGGSCPVQIWGTVNGTEFYFRARGQFWSVGIGGDPVCTPAWLYGAQYSDAPNAAGHMEMSEAHALLDEALTRYLRGEPGNEAEYERARDLCDALSYEAGLDDLDQNEDPRIRKKAAELRATLEAARAKGLLPPKA